MADNDLPDAPWEKGSTDELPDAPWIGGTEPSKGPMSWGDVAKGAVTSLPGSAAEFGKSMAQPFIHPIDTLTNLKNLAQGAAEKVGLSPTTGHEKYADALGQFITDRYGSMDAFKKTLATDPVGVAADISAIATGGGGALARAPGLIGRAGEIAATAGRAIDPINAAARVAAPVARGVGNVAAHTLGLTTGAGPIAVESAARAGYEGGQADRELRENMRGTQPMSETVDQARQAVNNMRQARGQEYVRQMQAFGANQTVYPGIWADIGNSLRQASAIKTFKGVDLRPSTMDMRQNLADTVSAWYRRNPADYHTLEGFDALKQQVGDLKDNAPFGSPQRAQADIVYNAIRNAIVRADPQYGRIMNAYDDASHELREIERTLSLGKNRREGPSIDTSLRKLQSTLRDNVNTSFGRRRELLQYLMDNGAPHLMDKLAGQALSSGTPRGLSRLGIQLGTEMMAIGAGSALLHPGVAALGATHLAASSPRLVGESARYAGMAARYLNRAAGVVPPRSAYQAGRLYVDVYPNRVAEDPNQNVAEQRAIGGRISISTRRESNYSPTRGKPDHHCGSAPGKWEHGYCAHFKKPHSCSIVGGFIAARGVCDWYKRFTARADGGRISNSHFQDADEALGFNKQEADLYKRHLDNLWGDGGVTNPNGSRSSLYQAVQPHDGKFYNIPTVWNGKIETQSWVHPQTGKTWEVPNQTALDNVEKEGWDKFPSYSTSKEADDRYQDMHGFMEQDTGDYFNDQGRAFGGRALADGGDPGDDVPSDTDQAQDAAEAAAARDLE